MSFNEFLEKIKHIPRSDYDNKPDTERAQIHQEWCDGAWKVSVEEYLKKTK